MNFTRAIGWLVVANACTACGTTSLATLGGATYVLDTNQAPAVATVTNPNIILVSPTSTSPQFVVTTNWESEDSNLTTSSPGLNFIVANDPNLCIDIASGNPTPNALVQTWACNGYDPAQAWFLFNGQLHSQAGLCLDTVGDDVEQAVNVVTQPCDSTLTRRGQLWNFTGGLLQITNSSRCLMLDNPANGAVPVLTTCNFPDTRQSWIGARSDGSNMRGAVISTAVANSACLYVDGSADAGTPITLRACDFGIFEQFVLEDTHLRALGKCVQAPSIVGASLTIETCTNDISQKWVWSNGALQLEADIQKCIGLVNNSTADDAPVQVQGCSGAVSQQWSLGTAGY